MNHNHSESLKLVDYINTFIRKPNPHKKPRKVAVDIGYCLHLEVHKPKKGGKTCFILREEILPTEVFTVSFEQLLIDNGQNEIISKLTIKINVQKN